MDMLNPHIEIRKQQNQKSAEMMPSITSFGNLGLGMGPMNMTNFGGNKPGSMA